MTRCFLGPVSFAENTSAFAKPAGVRWYAVFSCLKCRLALVARKVAEIRLISDEFWTRWVNVKKTLEGSKGHCYCLLEHLDGRASGNIENDEICGRQFCKLLSEIRLLVNFI